MADPRISALPDSPSRPLPSGTVAFLFTDIEGSTQRWERYRDAMDAAVKRHDSTVRGAIEAHNGYVFKTVGDAFCAAFGSASDALDAAIGIQIGLAREDFAAVDGLRVRAGLHVGEASERDGDYFGPAVNRTARLMSIGHGGQTLLSGRMRDFSGSALPPGTSLVDLGLRRLKDLTEPEHVWQLTSEGSAQQFPPLTSLDARPNNLPEQLTRLIGRDAEADEVEALVTKHRIVTLTGSGGIGKTRLALQVAADLLDRYPDGVWFADLAPISDPELVASVVAQSLGMTQGQASRVDEAIVEWLKRKKLILVLDNCEHLVETIASLADSIVRRSPDVRILATSRQVLGIDGEIVYSLSPLAVPSDPSGMQTADVQQFGAIALFVERASAAYTRFSVTDSAMPVIAEICRRLDGIPLAIELAAARVKILTIPNLAKRLDDRFKILTGGSRSALPRQKTLTALIDWSYDLLSPQERSMLARVSIFAGGFGLDAATAVCAGEGIDESDVLDLLSSLTDKSLIVADTARERERFRLLESTRAYSMEKLTAGGERDHLARRHAEYFRENARAADARYFHSPTAAWIASEELEIDNNRAALEWALTDGRDVPLAAGIAGNLLHLWILAGLLVEGRYWIERAQAGLDEATHPLEAARLWLALASSVQAKPKRDYALRALAIYESMSDPRGLSWALFYLTFALFQMGRLEEALPLYEKTLAAMLERGDRRGIAACFNVRGLMRSPGADLDFARNSIIKAIEVQKSLDDQNGLAVMLGNLAEIEFLAGDVERALARVREALEISLHGKDALILAIDHTNLAAYCIAAGDLEAARVAAREGLKWAEQSQHTLGVAIVLQHLALIGALLNDVDDAARLIGYVNARLRALSYEREHTERWCLEKLMVALRDRLSDADIERLATEGEAWTDDRAIQYAMTV
jgi:predicted ATPase/class 3 adenylate cyclase